jgi:DNA-binding XRE family transcriptional regulator
MQMKGGCTMKLTLKGARANAGYTQSYVAKHLKISKNTLVNYEKYRTIPDIEMAKRIASLYGISVNDLIFLPSDCTLSTT